MFWCIGKKTGVIEVFYLKETPELDEGPFLREERNLINAIAQQLGTVTERKQAEQELAKADKLESVGILAGGIAHDFNNILTGILGNVSLAKMDLGPDTETFQLLNEAEEAAARASDLTMQLLTFSNGGAPIKKAASIEEIIRKSSSFALRGSNVKYDLSVQDDLSCVKVDVSQMNQVITNLVINADQSMPEGGRIIIRVENVNVGANDAIRLHPGDYVKITVKDHGIGIPKDYLSKIFDPFFTTKQKGNGLGLATTYSIIRQHNGFIDATSELGVGTVFRVYLPASEEKVGMPESVTDELLTGTGRILVMDDEELVRKTAGAALTRFGYDVDFALDGEEAIAKYRDAMKSDHPYDAVILDLTIPGGMGGKEAIKKLKTVDPDIRAIVSSGYSNDPVLAQFCEYGFCGAAKKPYKVKELCRVVQEILTAE